MCGFAGFLNFYRGAGGMDCPAMTVPALRLLFSNLAKDLANAKVAPKYLDASLN